MVSDRSLVLESVSFVKTFHEADCYIQICKESRVYANARAVIVMLQSYCGIRDDPGHSRQRPRP